MQFSAVSCFFWVKCKTTIHINLEELKCRLFVLVAMHLVEFVLLAKLNTLFPAVVALEKVGCDPPKLNQLMLLQALGQ